MAYSQEIISRARRKLESQKADWESRQRQHQQQVYAAIPRVREIDMLLRRNMTAAAQAVFTQGGDPRAAMEQVRQENQILQREREDLILAQFPPEYAREEPICPNCGGSGYVGSRMCACLLELCRQEQKKELSSLLGGKESFDGFRLDLYPTEPDPNLGVSPRQLMERTFRRCRRYAREFGAGAPSLLFTGGPGLGKTFLSACIARAVADNGFSVVYDTAGKLFSDFEAVKFGGNQQDLTRKYLQCDLLIIDDLGTEMTTQFTQSVLYRVLNDRLLENRPVIVSTNLSDQALRQRYSAPIASRLLGAFEVCLFLGQDIRQLHA